MVALIPCAAAYLASGLWVNSYTSISPRVSFPSQSGIILSSSFLTTAILGAISIICPSSGISDILLLPINLAISLGHSFMVIGSFFRGLPTDSTRSFKYSSWVNSSLPVHFRIRFFILTSVGSHPSLPAFAIAPESISIYPLPGRPICLATCSNGVFAFLSNTFSSESTS